MSVDRWLEQHHHGAVRGVTGILVAGMAVGGFYVSHELFALANRNAEQRVVINQLSSGLDTSRTQLQVNGITPQAPTAREIVDSVIPKPVKTLAPAPVRPLTAQAPSNNGLPLHASGLFLYTIFDPKRKY